MGVNFRKMHFRKKLNYDFSGIWTLDLCCSFMIDKSLSYRTQSALIGILIPYLFCSFRKDKTLSYSVSGGWMVFKNITTVFFYQNSTSIRVRTSHKIQVKFDLDTKTKSFSTPRHKTNQFRSLSWNQVKFNPSHWNQINLDHPDKTNSISMLTLKPSDLRPASKNRVNFDHHHPHKN